jgi:hypothetical protein
MFFACRSAKTLAWKLKEAVSLKVWIYIFWPGEQSIVIFAFIVTEPASVRV